MGQDEIDHLADLSPRGRVAEAEVGAVPLVAEGATPPQQESSMIPLRARTIAVHADPYRWW